jgi:MFS family permease
MKSPGTRGSSGAVVGTVALASLLNPLNTSMLAVALPQVQREFGTSAGASTWLHTVFAFVSALGHPLAGVLADRLGPRRVLIAGLCVTGASALAAASVERFSLLLSLRAVQALGTSTAFPAGMALLRVINARERPLSAAWLGTVAMTGNLGAAVGPILGGVFLETVGWRAIFLMNLPLTVAGALLVLSQSPVDRVRDRGDRGALVGVRAPARRAPLVSVYARFAAACTVFFAAFFALPLWLDQSRGLSPVATGAMMLPLVLVSALATPLAIRTVSRSGIPRTLVWGASGLCLGTGLLATVTAQAPMVIPVGAMVALGAAHAFNNLGLQAELSEVTPPARFGTTAGFFQTARFVGAGLAAGLLGIMVADAPTTDRLYQLWIVTGLLSVVLLVWATRSSTKTGTPLSMSASRARVRAGRSDEGVAHSRVCALRVDLLAPTPPIPITSGGIGS